MNRIPELNSRKPLSPLVALAALLALSGCGLRSSPLVAPGELLHYQNVALKIETPDLKPSPDDTALATASPETISETGPVVYWDMKLADAMQTALTRSKVMHDLGGAELRSPQQVRTISDPAITDTDPRFGVDSALADYDAVFNASADSQHNHRALNNIFFGGGTRILIQDLDTFKEEIVKETPTGTEFTFRHNTVYDNNNEPGNLFPSAWDTNFEAEVRQHLLQGGGLEYNRIAGPHGSPGQMNGVLIARINTDVALTDFEMGIRDLASNVENAYWDLYFAYRDLDANVLARDNALESWRRTHALFLAGRRGGEAEKEAQVRQQYFQFQEAVENAWNGRLVDGTHTDNGSGGGTFRGGGVRVAERRLRRLLGLPISDGRLIRPADEPALAKMVFAWDEILPEALTRRPELRRQRWMVKRRELELIASRNFLLPTLDVTGLYRFRGFGHDLIDTDRNQAEFDSAYGDLGTGMFQEWELGAQFSMPIGDRKGHVAVRNAQLNLARERAILDDQEQEIVHDLSNALAEVDRAYSVAQTAFNRRIAARSEVAATQAAFESDKVPLDLFLEAQRRQADSESNFFAALVEYALAIKNLHYAKGSLLDYNEIYLSEGPWPAKAYADAAKLKTRKHELLDYRMKSPPVSAGPIPQAAEPVFGVPQVRPPIETLPPGAEGQPLPPGAIPLNLPSTTIPPADVIPLNPPPASQPLLEPPPVPEPSLPSLPGVSPSVRPQTTPQEPLPPQPQPPQEELQPVPPKNSGPDFSTSQASEQPDLQPRNRRRFGPTVQPVESRPLGMDEIVASQPPPSAAAAIASPADAQSAANPIAAPVATAALTTSPQSANRQSTAPLGASQSAPEAGPADAKADDIAPSSAPLTNNLPADRPPTIHAPAPPESKSAAAEPSETASTLSIYSRSIAAASAHDIAPPNEASQLRVVSQAGASQPEMSLPETTLPEATLPETRQKPSAPGRVSWPESKLESLPPVIGADAAKPTAPSGVQPASYPENTPPQATPSAAPSEQLQPLPPVSLPPVSLPPTSLPLTSLPLTSLPPTLLPIKSLPPTLPGPAPLNQESLRQTSPSAAPQSQRTTSPDSTLPIVQPLPPTGSAPMYSIQSFPPLGK